MERQLIAKPLVEKLKIDLKNRTQNLISKGITPSMAVILVGSNPSSLVYIKNKKKLCEEIGANFKLIQLDESISESDFLNEVSKLNKDDTVQGIIIQLPVSKNLKNINIQNLIVPQKDIDGFHESNVNLLYSGTKNLNNLIPCTPKGIVSLLKYYNIEIESKNIVVVGRSLIVGKPLSMLLSNLNATVTLAHSKTKNLETIVQHCDIVIVAVGQKDFITASFITKDKTIIIDVGINQDNTTIIGDVSKEALLMCKFYSPVPGGVGPMTVISLIDNLIIATERQFINKEIS